MHLKNLHLHGFKTFAERTEIEFSQGVTAVVGPNGSGKSNIADAILWVLGEQKASAVRGARASDVIFSGSDKRKPMGMAEVSLTVDNSDGTLPYDFNEVTVTRRAYRTGDADYFINKTPCRLKDIYELFLDTGVGREAYSLVNQGEIDAVLSANPEDRRGLFEEAAGIKKYRVKKREAIKKLDATEQNLQRVRDILGETETRIEPLRLQAEQAERYTALRDRLREIESNLLIVDLRFTHSELTVVQQNLQRDQARLDDLSAAIAEAEAEAEALDLALTAADTELERRRATHQNTISELERDESRRALAAQRAESLTETLSRLAQEREELTARQARLTTGNADADAEARRAEAEQVRLRGQVDARRLEIARLSEQIATMTRDAERRRAEAQGLARQQAARQADLARAEARVAELDANLPAAREELAKVETGLTEARQKVVDTTAAITAAEVTRTDAEQALTNARQARDSKRAAAESLRGRVNAADSERVGLSSRLRTLTDLENAREGYYAGVRSVFDAVKHGKLSASFTVAADAFVTPQGYESAFETALGGSLQDIIADRETDAKFAIRFLHDTRSGRATFLPLDSLRPSRSRIELGRAQGLTGFRGAALDLIEFDPRFRPALEVLLGRVLICDTLDDAIQVSHTAQGWSRIVSLTGEIVNPSGALTGGRQAGRASGALLERKTELADLNRQLEAKQVELERLHAEQQRAETERTAADAAVGTQQTALNAAQLEQSETRRRAEYARGEVTRTEEAQRRAIQRLEQLQQQLAQARRMAASAGEVLTTTGVETAGADSALEAESRRAQAAVAERDSLRAELTRDQIALAAIDEKVHAYHRTRRAAEIEAEQVAEQMARKLRQEQDAQLELREVSARATVRQEDRTQAITARDNAQKALEEQLEVRQTLSQQAHEAASGLRRDNDERATVLESIRKSDVRDARLQSQREQMASRLRDEYEVVEEIALGLEDDPEVADRTPQEVARLRRDLRAMGDVNIGAIVEYEEVRTRYEFLSGQKFDLEDSRAKLLHAIKDIDESTRGVFMDTYKAVGVAFDTIFQRLFGGGRTELVLTTPDDILETGIDIVAQPPGKKRQNLQLLSGGERALTATALLFAFLEVKPSPFVVMDEVDAPLDGANVERFADLLRDFGQKSQMIIITHNPTTMEAAPIWYGVTMQEPGISRILGLQAPHVTEGNDHSHNGNRAKNGHAAAATPEPIGAA